MQADIIIPKISVIVAVYNVEPYLERSINCLINQTLKDMEFIFIDDCSTDNSLKILKEYAQKDNRIKVIESEKNNGAAVARNKGLEIAKGEYLGFIDPDDAIDLNYYEVLYKTAKENNVDIAKCKRKEIYPDGQVITSTHNEEIRAENSPYWFSLEWTTAIYRHSFIKKHNIKFPEECIKAQDVVFLARIIFKHATLKIIDDVCYYYYKREGSLNAKKIPIRNIKSALLAVEIILQEINNSNLFITDKKLYLKLYVSYLCTIFYTLFQNDSFETKQLCAEAIIKNFFNCMDIEALSPIYPYPWMLKSIKNKNANKLTKLISKYKKPEDIRKPLTFFQQIFSVRTSSNPNEKVLTLIGLKFKIPKKNKKSIAATKIIHNNITRYKYIHIMKNDKFNKPFVDFLNNNFNKDEHMVLCYREPSYNSILQKFPEGNNVYEYFNIFDIDLNYNNINKVIVHSLFMPDIIDYLYKNQDVLKNKSYWVMWGNDLYNAPRDEKNDFVRSNFKGYLNKIDENYVRTKYNLTENQKVFDVFYLFPTTKNMLDNIKITKKDYIQIQINNSCDKSTFEMLDILSKFRDENIKITTVLSYGDIQYKYEIIKKGKEIFGSKFNYIEELMKPEQYIEHLAQNDILIFNQNRQQGFGNIVSALNLGIKVYIKNTVSVNGYFNKNGIKIYNTEDIENITFEEFIKNDSKEQNKTNIAKYSDNTYLRELWKAVFDE